MSKAIVRHRRHNNIERNCDKKRSLNENAVKRLIAIVS